MILSDSHQLLDQKSAPLGDFARLMRRVHIDGPLLGGLLLICALGLVVLYSAVGENMRLWLSQVARLSVAIVAMFLVAQLSQDFQRRWTPWA